MTDSKGDKASLGEVYPGLTEVDEEIFNLETCRFTISKDETTGMHHASNCSAFKTQLSKKETRSITLQELSGVHYVCSYDLSVDLLRFPEPEGQEEIWNRSSASADSLARNIRKVNAEVKELREAPLGTIDQVAIFLREARQARRSNGTVLLREFWFRNFSQELEVKELKAAELLRGEFLEEFIRGCAEAKLPIPDFDINLFPEAFEYALTKRQELIDFIVADKSLKIVNINAQVFESAARIPEFLDVVYETFAYQNAHRNARLAVVPAAVAFFFASEGRHVASIPPDVSSEQLTSAIEALKVIYNPMDSRSPYWILEVALAAALEL